MRLGENYVSEYIILEEWSNKYPIFLFSVICLQV
jgi:hypothetical protein